jgi:hypothetical protein
MLTGGLAALLAAFGGKGDGGLSIRPHLFPSGEHLLAGALAKPVFALSRCRAGAQSAVLPAPAGFSMSVDQGLRFTSAAGAGSGITAWPLIARAFEFPLVESLLRSFVHCGEPMPCRARWP